jgi:shikimate 5-dehydrogenase
VTRRRVYFVGVSTAGSSVVELFPRWSRALRLDAELATVDLPVGASAEAYRRLVGDLAADDAFAGAVITTHKVDLFRTCRELFSSADPSVDVFEEIACVRTGANGLSASTIDPVSTGLTLREMLGPGYWSGRAASALVLGAGGAGTAAAATLFGEADQPASVTLTDTDPGRLDRARRVMSKVSEGSRVSLAAVRNPEDSTALVASMPAGSLVVNATGMGKDTPGSPLSTGARFPERGVVWDLNYRGDLTFLEAARAQQQDRELRVFDGRRLFWHGWAEGLCLIFDRQINTDLLAEAGTAGSPD